MRKIDLGLPTYEESLFSTEEQRQEAKLEKVMKIPIDEIHSFKNHPFHVRKAHRQRSGKWNLDTSARSSGQKW